MLSAASLRLGTRARGYRYPILRSRHKSAISVIYSIAEFRELITKECERADRYRSRFSLAIFEVGTVDESSVLIRRLVRTIHHRFRNTDDVGWYRAGQIGIILPFTPAEGAWKLAEYVSSVIASITAPPAFSIFSYPSANWPEQRLSRRISSLVGISFLLRRLYFLPVPKADELHAMIARERGRSDRNGNIFSLIIFKMENLPPGISTQRQMLLDLNNRLRDTDEIGWFDDRHLSAILPYAARADAQRIAEVICRHVGVQPGPDFYLVYTYPDNWFPERKPAELEIPEPVAAKQALPEEEEKAIPDLMEAEAQPPSDPTDSAQQNSGTFLFRPVPLWKRALDIFGSLFAIFLLSPFFLLALLIIKFSSPGPVFFRQQRIGYMGRPFRLFKFRTMEVNVETKTHSQYMRKLIVEGSDGLPMTKIEHHPGIIQGGRLLRSSCIDELPQLFNVLFGQMSLVGPRPCLPYEAGEYLRWHARRFDSVPGMTGLWQVKGKNRTTFKEMIRLDIQYALRRSFWLDLKILFLTPIAILRQIME